MASTGQFDNYGTPAGSFTRMDDLVDVDSTDARDGQVLVYKAGRWKLHQAAAAGVQDHSQLFNLDADDHPQYLTNVRGDARYDPKDEAAFLSGKRMKWRGSWPQPSPYNENDVIRDGTWLMVANKRTWDRPGPSMDGEQRWRIPTSTLFEYRSSTARELLYGQRYQLSSARSVFLQRARVWVPDVDVARMYRVWVVTGSDTPNPVWTEVAAAFRAAEAKWVEIPIPNILVQAGSTFDVIVSLVDFTTTTTVKADYAYVRHEEATVEPPSGSIVHTQADVNLLLISKQDYDGVDRTSSLRQLGEGSLIEADGEMWHVRAIGEETRHFRVVIAPVVAATTGVHEFTFTTFAPQSAYFGRKTDHWVSAQTGNMVVRGLMGSGGYSTLVPDMHAYSVDLYYQEVVISPDWDVVSTSGGLSGGGGTSEHSHDETYVNVNGDYMEGPLHVWAATAPDQAAQLQQVDEKIVVHSNADDPHPQYLLPGDAVDTFVKKTGDTMTGPLVADNVKVGYLDNYGAGYYGVSGTDLNPRSALIFARQESGLTSTLFTSDYGPLVLRGPGGAGGDFIIGNGTNESKGHLYLWNEPIGDRYAATKLYVDTTVTGALSAALEWFTGVTGAVSAAAGVHGTSTQYARGDHTHPVLTSATTPSYATAAAGSPGSTNALARADHAHQVNTAAPVALGSANNIGTSNLLARADHIHVYPSAAQVGADPQGAGTAAVGVHVSLPDPHSQYANKVDTQSALNGLTEQVSAILGDLRYCGTYNALTHKVNTLSAIGLQHPQYAVGQPLPDTGLWNARHYFLVVVSGPTAPDDGIYEPEGTPAQSYEIGDWIISNGGGVGLLGGRQVTIEPMISMPEASNRWVHLPYAARNLLATAILTVPSITGVNGETVQQALQTTYGNLTTHTSALDPHQAYLLIDGSRAMTGKLTAPEILVEGATSRLIFNYPGVGGTMIKQAGAGLMFKNTDDTAYEPILIGTPTWNEHAATKKYVDDIRALLVEKSGSVMTGNLSIPDGTTSAHAVNYQQLLNVALAIPGTDATVPTPASFTSGHGGSSTKYSKIDHRHSMLSGVPVGLGPANSGGSATTVSRSDHVHIRPTLEELGITPGSFGKTEVAIGTAAPTRVDELLWINTMADPALYYWDHPSQTFKPLPTRQHNHDDAYVPLSHASDLLGDPHPQYVTASEANGAYEPKGEASRERLAHENTANDPHPKYREIQVGGTTPTSTDIKLWIDTSV